MTTISPHTTRAPGTILTATIYNFDHGNHIANAQALNIGKVEGAGSVVDGAFALFDGVSGAALRSGGLAINNAMLADMDQSTIKGRAAGAGTGDPQDLTGTQATAILNTFTSALKGLVPASGGGTTNFLRADGSFASPSASLIVVIQVFTASGTYTPTAGMDFCIIEAQAPGGGSGGADGVGRTGGAGVTAGVASGGGGGGEYRRGVFSAATIGASQSVTINAAGTAGTDTGGNGGNGGTVSVGALISANGGSGGTGTGSNSTSGAPVAGGAGGSGGSGGSFSLPGQDGGYGFIPQTNPDATAAKMKVPGNGGNSFMGRGAVAAPTSGAGDAAGIAGGLYGGGAAGATDDDTTGSAGAAGGAGIVVITEFIIA